MVAAKVLLGEAAGMANVNEAADLVLSLSSPVLTNLQQVWLGPVGLLLLPPTPLLLCDGSNCVRCCHRCCFIRILSVRCSLPTPCRPPLKPSHHSTLICH